MKNFLKSVADYVFSFYTIWFGLVVLFGLLIINVAEKENADTEQKRVATEACYAQGMVLVQSDAGQRCVLPQSLVKVK
jgi:hypothetical protein